MFGEILYRVKPSTRSVPIYAFTDNKSLVDNAYSTTMPKEHRLKIDMAIVKEMINNNELQKLFHVKSADQVADCLTKKGVNPTKFRRYLRMVVLNERTFPFPVYKTSSGELFRETHSSCK